PVALAGAGRTRCRRSDVPVPGCLRLAAHTTRCDGSNRTLAASLPAPGGAHSGATARTSRPSKPGLPRLCRLLRIRHAGWRAPAVSDRTWPERVEGLPSPRRPYSRTVSRPEHVAHEKPR